MGLIGARIASAPQAMAARLAARARVLAAARAETVLRARKRDPWRWRSARLLWPRFTKG